MSLLIAPLEALTDPSLTDTERRVLLALYSFRNKHANTVWPSLEALAERALIKDIPRVSKITGSLAEKGWLTKRKRGFTGGNIYSLTEPTANELSDDAANLAEFTKLGEDTNANLAEFTKSNLAKSTKYRELQIEEQIEQQNKEAPPIGSDPVIDPPKRKPSRAKPPAVQLDYSAWPTMPSAQVMADWVAARKAKRAPISQTVITQFGNELHKAAALGYSVDQCLAECITSGWQGFKAAWIANRNNTGGTNGKPERISNFERVARDAERHIAELDRLDRLDAEMEQRNRAVGHGAVPPDRLIVSIQGQ